ncbi:MAG: GerMN domain-containing protein [Micrococcales bacterium]|nr:GerMN domain-containing protein [Micrococcales bacterium]
MMVPSGKACSAMKRFFAITSALVVAFSLAACGSGSGDDADNTGSSSTETPVSSDPPAHDVPSTPAVTSVDLYLPNADADGFVIKTVTTGGDPAHIISLLVAEGALPAGCALNSFTTTGDDSAKVDMNAAYGRAVSSMGTAGERMLLGSVVNTLLTYFNLKEITLTIDGEILETGHIVLDFPLGFHEND